VVVVICWNSRFLSVLIAEVEGYKPIAKRYPQSNRLCYSDRTALRDKTKCTSLACLEKIFTGDEAPAVKNCN
jgi:hypothetical protein